MEPEKKGWKKARKRDPFLTDIRHKVKEARKPWQRFDRDTAQLKKEWQQDKAKYLEIAMAEVEKVIDDAPRWMRTLPDSEDEQVIYDCQRICLEVALRTSDMVDKAIAAAQEQGQDTVEAGYKALFEAGGLLTPIAVGEMMNSAHQGLNENTTFLLSGGMARRISLSARYRLTRHFRSLPKDPTDGLHEELPAALRVAYAKREDPLQPVFKGDFIGAVIKEITGEMASVKDMPFPMNAETEQTLEIADRINPLLPEQDQDTPRSIEKVIDQSNQRNALLALADRAHLSKNERQLFDLFLDDADLSTYGGNKELGERLGRSAVQVGTEKKRLRAKLQKASQEQSD